METGRLEIGTVLDQRYEILGFIGRGSFGVVYEARDRLAVQSEGTVAVEWVAIKQLPGQCIIDCERQADVRVLLQHPAIPRIFGYFSEGEYAYLVQERVTGWDLETVLVYQKSFLSEKTVVGWSIQLCDFLHYLHTHPYYPMIFRDMKPNNVMVDRADRLHVVDFGLARIFPPGNVQNPQPPFEHLLRGLPIGTQGYAPPEQYEGYICLQSDIYALGATLHHLLTRRDPRKDPPASFEKAPIRSINPQVSSRLEAIVMKAVDVDVARRFASARVMREALERLATRLS